MYFTKMLYPIKISIMKHFKFLLIALYIIGILSCNKETSKKVWIYSNSQTGMIYTGLVFDLSKQPIEIYSIAKDFRFDSIHFENDNVLRNNDTIVRILWKNENSMVARYGYDTIMLQAVPDLHLSDQYEKLYDLLTQNSYVYEDKWNHFQIKFDTTLFETGIFKSLIFDLNTKNGYTQGTWMLRKINGSIILFNTNPIELFHKPLLITNIYKDSIIALNLEIAYNELNKFMLAVSEGEKFNFNYDKCILKKVPGINETEKKKLIESLSSKVWTAKKVDTILLSSGVPIGKWDSSRFYNKYNFDIKYKFTQDGIYSFILQDTTYSGKYIISDDGKHLLLDSIYSPNDFVELIEVSKDKIKTRQQIEIKEDNRHRSFYNYDIEFE